MVKISFGSWAYIFGPYANRPVPLEEVAKRISKFGYDGIELTGFKPHAHPELYPAKKDRKNLVKMLSDNGLGISGYGPEFSTFFPASPDSSIQKGYEKCFDEGLKFCTDCGVKILRVDTGCEPPLPKGVDYQTAWNELVKMWQKCTKKAAEEGVLVVWEFEPGFMFNKPGEVVKLVEDIGSPNFKILFDSCHAHMCAVMAARQTEPKETLNGGVSEFIEKLTGKIGHIHLIDSDNTLHDNMTSTHAPFGKGVLNFDEIMPAILESGFNSEWWTVDLCFWPEAWEVTEESFKFVDGLRKKYGKI